MWVEIRWRQINAAFHFPRTCICFIPIIWSIFPGLLERVWLDHYWTWKQCHHLAVRLITTLQFLTSPGRGHNATVRPAFAGSKQFSERTWTFHGRHVLSPGASLRHVHHLNTNKPSNGLKNTDFYFHSMTSLKGKRHLVTFFIWTFTEDLLSLTKGLFSW